ncbi:MAG: DJ-1/PfpI family protein [Bacillota bacterium]|nr:DJ-1/PfpI family protein [Bacillota bacterium]
MVYIFLANGFEDIEAIAPIDILRRAKVEVKTVGVGGKTIKSARGISVNTDVLPEDVDVTKADMIILPGGPGCTNLEANPIVMNALHYMNKNGKLIAAICAAPSILGKRGMLRGKRATCFPGYEDQCEGMICSDETVCVDDNIITAKGAGASLEFGYKLAEILCGKETADNVMQRMQFHDTDK